MGSFFWTPDMQFRWDAVSALVALFGALVVLYQLRSVANQIKLQTDQLVLQAKQQKLQHYMEYTNRYHAIAVNFPKGVNEPDFTLSKRSKDYSQTIGAMDRYFDLCLEQWDLHRRNLIDRETWAVWQELIVAALEKPAFRQSWEVVRASKKYYSADFQKFISDILAMRR
jgi:hypothetical protein